MMESRQPTLSNRQRLRPSSMSLTTEQQQCLAVTALHNHGVALLEKDQHRQAHKAFVESLKRLKETLQFTSSASRNEASSSNRPSCFVRHALQVASETASHVPLQLFACVYSFPTMTVSSSSTSSIINSDPTSYQNRDGSAAVMFYNLAVTHHTRGLQLLESNAKAARICCTKALQFYHNALSAVQEWARRVVAPHQGIHELRLAILNNMAHAQALLGQHSAAHHSLTCLRDILRCGSKSCRGVPRSHLKFFATNLMVVFCLDDSPPRRRHHVIPNDDDDDAMAEEEPTTAAKTSSFAECVPPAAAA